MHSRNLCSVSRRAFWGHIRTTYVLPAHHLVLVIRDQTYSARFRAAALRNLVAVAPIEVTKGRCFAERRKLVRQHYQV